MSNRNEFTTLQRAWLDDLRTTTAPQAHAQLQDREGGNCCLGRACIVAGLVALQSEQGPAFSFFGEENDGEPTQEWGKQTYLFTDDGMGRCWRMNDADRLDFRQIADRIEASPWLYFSNFDVPGAA